MGAPADVPISDRRALKGKFEPEAFWGRILKADLMATSKRMKPVGKLATFLDKIYFDRSKRLELDHKPIIGTMRRQRSTIVHAHQ